jgi:hypothetical protein
MFDAASHQAKDPPMSVTRFAEDQGGDNLFSLTSRQFYTQIQKTWIWAER